MSERKPSWRITDRSHRWTPAADTNIRQTFAKIRLRQLLERRQREAEAQLQPLLTRIK